MDETDDDRDNDRGKDGDDDNKNNGKVKQGGDKNDNDQGGYDDDDDDGKHGGRRRTLLSEEQLKDLVSSLDSDSGSAGDASVGQEAAAVAAAAATAGAGQNEEQHKENQRLQMQSSPPSTTASVDNHPSLLQAQSAPGAYYVGGGMPEALLPPRLPPRRLTTPNIQSRRQHNSQLSPRGEERSNSLVEQGVNSPGNYDGHNQDQHDETDDAATTDTSVLATVPPRYGVATGIPANWPHRVTVAASPTTTAAGSTATTTANSGSLSSSVVSQLTDVDLNSLVPADSTPDDDAAINDRNTIYRNGNSYRHHHQQQPPPTTPHVLINPLHASLVEAQEVETDERLEARVAAEIQTRLQADFQGLVEQEVERKLRNIAQAQVVAGEGGSTDRMEEEPVGEGPVSFPVVSRVSRPSGVASTTTSRKMSRNSLSQLDHETNENDGKCTSRVFAIISNAFCWNEESSNAETAVMCYGLKTKATIWVTALLFVFISIAVGVGMFIAKDKSGSSVPESKKYFELEEILLQVTEETVLNNPDTPQNQALQWLAYDDRLQLDPNSNSSAAYEIVQRYVATVLYYATRGQRWENQCNFLNTTMSICEWNDVEKKCGLFCNEENNYLFGIDLKKNLLFSGPLPPEIGYLTSLKFISLSQNFVAGSIPSSLGLLTQLTDLELDGNSLTGTLPPELGRMTDMEFLYAFNNNLEGPIPDSLFLLSKLEVLWLRDNRFSGSLPTFRLPGMTYFDMNTNRLTGTLPLSICYMQNLTTFLMYSNDLKGDIPSCLGELSNLKTLSLEGNLLTGDLEDVFCPLRDGQTVMVDCYSGVQCSCCTCAFCDDPNGLCNTSLG